MVLRNRKLLYAGAAGLLLLVSFVLPSWLTLKGKGAVRSTVAPVERGTSGLGQRFAEAISAIRGMGGTVEENRELSHELLRVQSELNKLRDVEEENLQLRRAFDFRRLQCFYISTTMCILC